MQYRTGCESVDRIQLTHNKVCKNAFIYLFTKLWLVLYTNLTYAPPSSRGAQRKILYEGSNKHSESIHTDQRL